MNKWIDKHIEEFIKPNNKGLVPPMPPLGTSFHNFSDKAVKCLIANWNRAKQNALGKPIMLPGRDVYLFEILARMEKYPTTFKPEFSSCVARSGLVKETFNDHYMIDTGYSGSVPRALNQEHWGLMWYNPPYNIVPALNPGTQNRDPKLIQAEKDKHQIFPNVRQQNLAGQYSYIVTVAGYMESAPKYWDRAVLTYEVQDYNGGPVPTPKVTGWKQVLYKGGHFVESAKLTQYIVAKAAAMGHPNL